MITITKTDGSAIVFDLMTPGVTYPFRVNNTEAANKVVKICLSGNDGRDPSDASDAEGKEIALEGWVYVREIGGGAWTQIKEPATFPDSFDDLSDGCYVLTVGASSYADLEAKIEFPESPSTSGMAHFSMCAFGGAA